MVFRTQDAFVRGKRKGTHVIEENTSSPFAFSDLIIPLPMLFFPSEVPFISALQTSIFPGSWYGVWRCPHLCCTELGQLISNSRLLLGGRLWSRHLLASSSEFSLHVRLNTGENQQSTSCSPPCTPLPQPHVPLSVHHHFKLWDHLWMLPFDPEREVTPLLQSLQWLSTVFKVKEKKQFFILSHSWTESSQCWPVFPP